MHAAGGRSRRGRGVHAGSEALVQTEAVGLERRLGRLPGAAQMSREEATRIPLRPKIDEAGPAGAVFSWVIQQLANGGPGFGQPPAEWASRVRSEGLRRADQIEGRGRAYLRVIVSVLADLVAKGWSVGFEDGSASISPPSE